jgi:UDP:flavonoid glycosyltransferase YjiC (YdhE family)
MNQALINKLPQISIPTSAEQQWNCDLTMRKGLGMQILPGDLTAEALRDAVQALLGEKESSG